MTLTEITPSQGENSSPENEEVSITIAMTEEPANCNQLKLTMK